MARFASEEVKAELIKVANQLIENGKGLLAADEGHPVVGARLEKVTYEKDHIIWSMSYGPYMGHILMVKSYGFLVIYLSV